MGGTLSREPGCTGFDIKLPTTTGCTGFDITKERQNNGCFPASQTDALPTDLLKMSSLWRKSTPSESQMLHDLQKHGSVSVITGVEPCSGDPNVIYSHTPSKLETATISADANGNVYVQQGDKKRQVTGDEASWWLKLAQDQMDLNNSLAKLHKSDLADITLNVFNRNTT